MKMTTIPIFAALLAAGLGAGWPEARASGAAPLSVTLDCGDPVCVAEAAGGTGSYSFTWTNAHERYDSNGFSTADPICPGYPDFPDSYVYVSVTVTDSSGATASAGPYPVSCGMQSSAANETAAG